MTDRRHGRGGLAAGRAARRRRPSAPRSASCSRRRVGGRPLAAHEAKALMRSLLDVGVDVRALGARHGHRRLPARSRPSRATCSTRCCRRYARLELPDRRRGRRGPARPRRRRRVERRPAHGPARAGGRPADRARSPDALDDQGAAPAVRRDRGAARRRPGPHGARRASASTPTSCAALHDRLTSEVERLRQADLGRRRRPSSTSTPRRSCARSCSTSSGLTPQKKTKTGYSTDAASLEKLRRPAPDHRPPAAPTARSRSCGRPTARACWPRWRADGRIHATFNQTVARTGRLSSDQPNLHNIPVRSDVGREFRRAFVPAPGLRAAGRRLQPDRAALHRPPRARTRA